MQRYYWQGIDLNGQGHRGLTLASDRQQLHAYLREHQIVLEQAWPLPRWLGPLLNVSNGRIQPRHITAALRQTATLIGAGVPLVQALEMMAQEQRHRGVAQLLGRIREQVAGGLPLSLAMAEAPRHFDRLTRALVSAGEQASTLDTLLERIAAHREQADALKQGVRQAMFYPLIVLITALLVSIGLLLFVVPRFEAMFAEFGADLPAFTQAVMRVSASLREIGWLGVAAGLSLGLLAVAVVAYHPQARYQRDALWLRVPIAGTIIARAHIARFTRTLATMSRAGVPLAEALPAIAETLPNRCYQQGVLAMLDAVQDGHSIGYAVRHAPPFPSVMAQMLAIGEEAGDIEGMLERIAAQEEAAIKTTTAGLGKAVEPIIMAILGVVVGGLVLAMYLPVFRLGAAV